MSYADQNKAIRSRFNTNWIYGLPVKYDNADFTPPANDIFLEFQIHDIDETPVSIGNAVVYRNYGIISINIFAPLNTGTKVITGYCDIVASIFRGKTFSGIICRGARITRLGEIDGRFVKNISIEFFRDKET